MMFTVLTFLVQASSIFIFANLSNTVKVRPTHHIAHGMTLASNDKRAH